MKFRNLIIFILAGLILLQFSCKKDELEIYHYSFFSIEWDDLSSDEDNDGYVTSGILNCLINLEENATRRIYADVYYKLDNSDEYIYYSTSDVKNFNGADSPLFLQVPIGATETELAYGTYNFIVEIFEEGADNLSVSSAIDTMFMVTQKFERLADDQIYSITASWNSDLDNNADGYVRSSILSYDVNILNDLEKTIFAEIYLKNVDSTEWNLYETTPPYTITGDLDTDIDSVNIGRRPNELVSGEYDFRILVYESGGFFPVASLDNQTSSALSAKKFQTQDDDSYYYTIKENSINWTGITDADSDSYWESATLEFDVDVDKDVTRDLFAKVYVKRNDSANYICYDSLKFSIIYNDISDKQQLVINSDVAYSDTLYLDHGEYDFIISIYEDVPVEQRIEMYSIGDNTSANLSKQKFERP